MTLCLPLFRKPHQLQKILHNPDKFNRYCGVLNTTHRAWADQVHLAGLCTSCKFTQSVTSDEVLPLLHMHGPFSGKGRPEEGLLRQSCGYGGTRLAGACEKLCYQGYLQRAPASRLRAQLLAWPSAWLPYQAPSLPLHPEPLCMHNDAQQHTASCSLCYATRKSCHTITGAGKLAII